MLRASESESIGGPYFQLMPQVHLAGLARNSVSSSCLRGPTWLSVEPHCSTGGKCEPAGANNTCVLDSDSCVNRLTVALWALALAIVAVLIRPQAAAAQDGQSAETELVERYAPVIALRPQTEPCDTSGEQFAPAPADLVLDNPHMLLRQIGVENPVVLRGPTASDIFGMGGGFYIDFPGDAFGPGCLYERDYQRYNQGRNAVVYAHIATQSDRPDKLAVQYWFFNYYNDYNNLHEGDWEGIQLLFEVGTVEEALAVEPASIGYSQHFGGEVAEWGGKKLELVGSHPVVYPAIGSHASYFAPALYLGRSGSQGFGCDNTQNASRRLNPDVVLLPDEVTDPNDPLAWLSFEGLWGEKRFGPFSGATGPITKPRWTAPVDWHDTLRSSSVAVPGGSETTTPVVKQFCAVVGWGSSQYLTAQQHPLRVTGILAAIAIVLWYLSGLTAWSPLPAMPVVRRRRLGQIITSAAAFYWRHRGVMLRMVAMYVPAIVAASLLVAGIGRLLAGSAPEGADPNLGPIGAILIGMAGAAVQGLGLLTINAAVIDVADRIEHGRPVSAKAGFKAAFAAWRPLVGAALRGALIVLGLAVTIVGTPWAIRQYVRYQLSASAIITEDLESGTAALARSSALVSGRSRWFHTATVVLMVQGLVALVGVVAGLAFLLATNGLPLGLYSALTALASAFVLPFTAMAQLLLYGNVRAETEATRDGQR